MIKKYRYLEWSNLTTTIQDPKGSATKSEHKYSLIQLYQNKNILSHGLALRGDG